MDARDGQRRPEGRSLKETPSEKAEKEKDKSTDDKADPLVPANWDRCHAYLHKKKRFCRQQPAPSSKYCGNHQSLDVDTSSTKRKRVPCPIDPSHWIYEDSVDKHMKICPKAKKRKKQEEAIYYQRDANAGGFGSLSVKKEQAFEVGSLRWAQSIAIQVLSTYNRLFVSGCGTIDPKTVSFENMYDAIPLRDRSQPELDAGIVESFQSCQVKSGGRRHIPQLASLVGVMREMSILPSIIDQQNPDASPSSPSRTITFIEMGAGRGMLGLTTAGVASAGRIRTRLLMLERTGSRSKADKIFRRSQPPAKRAAPEGSKSPYLNLENVEWSRVECDVADVDMPSIQKLDDADEGDDVGREVVVIAKHLCGVGTDYALKAVRSISSNVCACVLATCCHGVCNWGDYVGRDFLRTEMETGTSDIRFGREEFALMCGWCAASVACQNVHQRAPDAKAATILEESQEGDNADINHHTGNPIPSGKGPGISEVTKSLNLACGIAGLGRACQRLIDYGRKRYLESEVFGNTNDSTVDLFHYVPISVTPQNAVLVAKKKKKFLLRDED